MAKEPPDSPDPFIDEYQIDEGLIDRWLTLDANRDIEVRLPRAGYDLLYLGIERSYDAIIGLMNMMAASKDDRVELHVGVGNDVLRGVNALRQFQTLVMAQATGVDFDRDGKIVVEGPGNDG